MKSVQQSAISYQRPRIPASKRSGFTLVELLVAVALIVLIMSMFAQVFRTASNLITRQRGMAENGQRARTLTTIIRGDISRRTFRSLVPFSNGEATVPADDDTRAGYFYYSENDPDNDADDVLQFTIKVGDDELPIAARALLLGDPPNGTPPNQDPRLLNQPEGDDGAIRFNAGNREIVANNLGTSRWAEVSYFLRNGNLYRRVLLIREPYDSSGPTPTALNGSTAYAGDFWNDFDYSAYFNAFTATGLQLHDTASLSNRGSAAVPALAFPLLRFGHDRGNSQPREYVGPANADFIGRFTMRETSHSDFGYPGHIPAGGNPMDRATSLTLNNGEVAEFGDGPRIAEDILLSNVHSFDVKLWDAGLNPQRFVDIGHNIAEAVAGGSFNKANNHHTNAPTVPYGPHATVADNQIFDTWHPHLDINGGGEDPPPYKPTNAGTPIPVRAIQITIRFFDVASNQMKQLTLQMPLVD